MFTLSFSTGDAGIDDSVVSKIMLAKTEISLTLSNKFEVPEDDQTDVTNLLLKYVQFALMYVASECDPLLLTTLLVKLLRKRIIKDHWFIIDL